MAFTSFGFASVCHAEEEASPNLKLSHAFATPRLTDGNGMILFFDALDNVGKFTFTGECIQVFPVFCVEKPILVPLLASKGYKREDFTYIPRQNGKKQTTFKGWPLYHYIKDGEPSQACASYITDDMVPANPAKIPPH